MARFTDDQINRLKQDISLQRLAEAQGIKLKKHGKDYIGLCPFHDDKEPSLVITPEKNLWHCLGACQSGGSVIDWVMKSEGISFKHATELLMNDYCPSLVANKTKPVKRSTVKKLLDNLPLDVEDQQLLNRVVEYYHNCLKQSPEALDYLKQRGITDSEAIDHFKLGFANRTLGYRLPDKNRKPGAAIREQLKKIGIYRESGHEHLTGALIIPVFDEHNNVTEVYGRKINRETKLRKGTPKHCYLPGPHKGIWNHQCLAASKEIILCESLIDALSFWCNGYRNVTTSYGIEGFTKEHLQAFKQNNIERILIAYDRDAAGEEATNKLSKQLIKEGLDCYRINFPKGMDANEYALQVTPATKSLGVVIRFAVWLGTGKAPEIKTTTKEEKISEATDSSSLAAELEDVIDTVLPASPLPDAPKDKINADVKENGVTITLGDRRYRVRGLLKNLSYDVMKVNLLVTKKETVHVDTFDLYHARHRATYIKQAAIELGMDENIIKRW